MNKDFTGSAKRFLVKIVVNLGLKDEFESIVVSFLSFIPFQQKKIIYVDKRKKQTTNFTNFGLGWLGLMAYQPLLVIQCQYLFTRMYGLFINFPNTPKTTYLQYLLSSFDNENNLKMRYRKNIWRTIITSWLEYCNSLFLDLNKPEIKNKIFKIMASFIFEM